MIKKIICAMLIIMLMASLLVFSPISAGATGAAALHVSENQLVNADGQAVRLLGVAVPQLAWSAYGDGNRSRSDAEILLEHALSDWQCNLIRLAVTPHFWLHGSFLQNPDKSLKLDGQGNPIQDVTAEEYRALVDKLIQKTADAGKYILLDNHSFYLPGQDSEDFWLDAAARYKDNPNVLFGLFNEPAACTWDQWYNGGTITFNGLTDWGEPASVTVESKGIPHLLSVLRSTGAKNVVTVSGLDWGYDLSRVTTTHRLTDPTGNLMYETHPYPQRDSDWDTFFGTAAKEYPVIFGECGPNQEAGKESQDAVYLEKLEEYLDKYDLHLAAWAMGAWPHLVDWSYWPAQIVPTTYGTAIRNYIIKNQEEQSVTLYTGTTKTGNKISINTGNYSESYFTDAGFDIGSVASVLLKTGTVYEYNVTFWKNSNYTGDKLTVTNESNNLETSGLTFRPRSVTVTRTVESEKQQVNALIGNKGKAVRAVLGDFNNVLEIPDGFGSESDPKNDRAKLTDGDKTVHIDIYGNLADEPGGAKDLPGVQYDLGDVYDVSGINAYLFTTDGYATKGIRVYASEDLSNLYKPESLILNTEGTTIEPVKSLTLETPIKARYVTFFFTQTESGWRGKEFEVIINKAVDDVPKIKTNLIAGNKGTPVKAMLCDFDNVLDVPQGMFGSESDPKNDRAKLTDGNIYDHIDIYGNLVDNPGGIYDAPGVQYDLGSVKEIHQLNAYVFANEGHAITGIRVYAAETLAELYKPASLVFNTEGTKYTALKTCNFASPIKARYVTFFLTQSQDQDWRVKEFEVMNIVPDEAAQPTTPAATTTPITTTLPTTTTTPETTTDSGTTTIPGTTTTSITTTQLPTTTIKQQIEVLLGDANQDKSVDIKDATEIQKHLAHLIVLNGEYGAYAEIAADVDLKGLDIRDVTCIQIWLAHLEGYEHTGETIIVDELEIS